MSAGTDGVWLRASTKDGWIWERRVMSELDEIDADERSSIWNAAYDRGVIDGRAMERTKARAEALEEAADEIIRLWPTNVIVREIAERIRALGQSLQPESEQSKEVMPSEENRGATAAGLRGRSEPPGRLSPGVAQPRSDSGSAGAPADWSKTVFLPCSLIGDDGRYQIVDAGGAIITGEIVSPYAEAIRDALNSAPRPGKRGEVVSSWRETARDAINSAIEIVRSMGQEDARLGSGELSNEFLAVLHQLYDAEQCLSEEAAVPVISRAPRPAKEGG